MFRRVTFSQFLVNEDDMSFAMADQLSDVDVDYESKSLPIDLENDERFTQLPPAEQKRIKIFARNMSPSEVEEELESTLERIESEDAELDFNDDSEFSSDDEGDDSDSDEFDEFDGFGDSDEYEDSEDENDFDEFGDEFGDEGHDGDEMWDGKMTSSSGTEYEISDNEPARPRPNPQVGERPPTLESFKRYMTKS